MHNKAHFQANFIHSNMIKQTSTFSPHTSVGTYNTQLDFLLSPFYRSAIHADWKWGGETLQSNFNCKNRKWCSAQIVPFNL